MPSALTVPFISGSTRSLNAEMNPRMSSHYARNNRSGCAYRKRREILPLVGTYSLIPSHRPDVIEQLHATKSMFPGQLLQMRRMKITLGDFFGEAAMFFVRFRVNGEKPNVLRLHLVLLNEAVPARRRGRTESAFGADLNRHDDKPWQRMYNQFQVITVS